MDNETKQKLDHMELQINEVLSKVERIRKYLFLTLVITLVVVILPVIGLIFVIPSFLSSYSGSLDSLNGLM